MEARKDHPHSPNVPRIVDVKMGTGEIKFKRSVGNLAVLEVESLGHSFDWGEDFAQPKIE